MSKIKDSKQDKDDKLTKNKNWPTKYKELEAKYKRALADYQNLIKQTAREKQDFAKYANQETLIEVLPVYDNLKMAYKHTDKNNHELWLAGVEHIIKQFKDILNSLGVEEIKTVGEKFDPHFMEAVAGKGEKVKEEARPGYRLKDRVIIPARVIVE